MKEFLAQNLLGNTYQQYLSALLYFIGGIIVIYVFKTIILINLKKWAEKTETKLDDLLIRLIEKSALPFFAIGLLYISIKTLNLSESFNSIFNIVISSLITFFIVKLIISVVNYGLKSYIKKYEDDESREKQLKGIKGLINILIWFIALIFLLDNLGVNISSIIAGLGIGGIAVAIAAQAILGDLFSYFVIFFDRPFEIGDFIVVGDKRGIVEQIGLKTTRIKSLGGEQLVFSNTDLTNSRLHNFKRMEKRRVAFNLGVIYQTPAEKLKRIPQIVKDIITKQEETEFDRGHFATYGDFSLNFEFVYFVVGADYGKFMDIQQTINLKIFETFEKEKIEFAYPSQTIFLNKENKI